MVPSPPATTFDFAPSPVPEVSAPLKPLCPQYAAYEAVTATEIVSYTYAMWAAMVTPAVQVRYRNKCGEKKEVNGSTTNALRILDRNRNRFVAVT